MENKKNNSTGLFIEKAEELIENVNKMAIIVKNFITHDIDGDPNLNSENRAALLTGAINKLKSMDSDEMSLTRLLPKGYKHSNKPFGSLLQDRLFATEASGNDLDFIASLISDAVAFVKEDQPRYKEAARTEVASRLYAAHVGLRSWQYRMIYVIGR